MRPNPRIPALAVMSALLLAVTVACSTDTGTEAPTADEREELFSEQCEGAVIPELPTLEPIATDDEGTTTTVDTDFGEVDLPSAPEAALGMYTTDVDMLVWLRYPLASQQPIRGDSGYQTFPCFFPYQALEKVGTFANYPDYNYEQILVTEPDFILNGLGYDKKVVKRLPDIAPTYSVDAFDGQSWTVHFQETAEALGREEYFEEWKAVYEERLAEVKEEIGDVSDGHGVSPPVGPDSGSSTTPPMEPAVAVSAVFRC